MGVRRLLRGHCRGLSAGVTRVWDRSDGLVHILRCGTERGEGLPDLEERRGILGALYVDARQQALEVGDPRRDLRSPRGLFRWGAVAAEGWLIGRFVG